MPMLKAIEKADDLSQFIIRQYDKDGNIKKGEAEVFKAEKTDSPEVIGKTLQTAAKGYGALRRAMLGLLAFTMKNPRLEGYKGKGDPVKGKYTAEFKSAMKECELDTFRQLVKDKCITLPAHDVKEKGEDAILREQANIILQDKNYSGVRAVVMKYWSFVGAHPSTSNGYLVPVAVMQAEVDNILAKHKVPEDTSFTARIRAIMADLEKETIASDDAINMLPLLRTLTATVQGIVEHEAAKTTAALTGVTGGMAESFTPKAIDVKADEAIRKAQESTGLQKPKTTGKPAVVKQD
jgi:hypothetical protein